MGQSSFAFESKRTEALFALLVEGFMDDYMRRKRSSEESGWRGLPQLARGLKVSPSSLYGKHGDSGVEVRELIRRGLVETRIFSGRRGRGGEVTRLRIAYDRDPVNEFVNSRIRGSEHADAVHAIVLPRNRLAVLPFVNISPNPSDEYIADGLTEELIDKISQVKQLEVISRTSAMWYKGKEKKAAEIGNELRAGYLVEGSVRRTGDRIRVTAQLVDSNTEEHIWSSRYDKDLHDVFAIQTDIAEQVAQSLVIHLLPDEKMGVEREASGNADARLLCMRGSYHCFQGTKPEIQRAIRYFEAAVALDPGCALGYAGLAECYHLLGDSDLMAPDAAYPKMKEYATRAIGIEPRLGEGHAALAAEYMHYEWRWNESEDEFRKAIAQSPSNAIAYGAYAYLLSILGRLEEAHHWAARWHELDPLAKPNWLGWFPPGSVLSMMGRNNEARDVMVSHLRSNPDHAGGHLVLGMINHRMGKVHEAFSEFRKAVFLSNDDIGFKAYLAFYLAISGQKEPARSILKDLEAPGSAYLSGAIVGMVLYALGREDEAFEALETAFGRRVNELTDVRMLPELARLWQDPRWKSIEAGMGLPEWGPSTGNELERGPG